MRMGPFLTDWCFFALESYGADPHWISVIKIYYSGIYSRSFFSLTQVVGISISRKFLSIIIFLARINVVIGCTLASSAHKFMFTGNFAFQLVRVFMDDLKRMFSSVSEAQKLLHRCVKALSWAGMYFRTDKSRSIVIVRGKSMNTTPFYVTEPSTPSDFTNYIPSIHSVPVKFLGLIINGSLIDQNSIDELQQKLLLGLNIINKPTFKGTQKRKILQHLLIPRIQWSLLIYEISISHASILEKKISKFIRKWLNTQSSTTDISLYSLISPCPLSIKSLASIFKSSKITGHVLLLDSKGPLVSSVSPSLKRGHWKATSAIQTTEAELNFHKIRGPFHLGRSSLGNVKPTYVPEEGSQAHCKLVTKTHKEIKEKNNLEKEPYNSDYNFTESNGKVTSKTVLLGKLFWQYRPIYYLFA